MKIMNITSIFLFTIFFQIISADDFPGNQPGSEIGGNLPAGYEPSGAVWHYGLQKLFLVNDDGIVSMMDPDGNDLTNWNVSGDLEGICIADHNSDFVYLGVEHPDTISEFDIITGSVTRSFDLTPWMTGSANLGLEALTFVADSTNAEGGLFYAGLQNDGKIYLFELPIQSSPTSTSVTYIETIIPVAGRSDLSGLHYETSNNILFAIWDSSNNIRAMETDGSNIVEWDLPGNDQEGITLFNGEDSQSKVIFVAEDTGKEVWKYDFSGEIDITINNNGSVVSTPELPVFFGTSVSLLSIPDEGNYFVEWSNDLTGNSNPETILLNRDKTITATFDLLEFPGNIIISITSDSVHLIWDEIPDAAGYNVYSSADPYADYDSWNLEAEGILQANWSQSIISEIKYYYVSAVY